jgi:hypothetical protein
MLYLKSIAAGIATLVRFVVISLSFFQYCNINIAGEQEIREISDGIQYHS